MGTHVIKLPDIGEGVAEAELVEWNVAVGQQVAEDDVLASVMTDKAAVEIPTPVAGTVTWLAGEIGDKIAVGAPLVRLEVAGQGNDAGPAPAKAEPAAEASPVVAEAVAPPAPTAPKPKGRPADTAAAAAGPPRREGDRPLASPAVRKRARDAGIDLRQVRGTGPAGRIGHDDLERFLAAGDQPAGAPGLRRNDAVEEVKIVGLRRRIAERMALAKRRIAHITYVEEVDVEALEDLRAALNKEKVEGRPRLTILPFLMRAMVKAVAEQPALNALYDDEAGVIHRHGGVHVGVATQTPAGLVVPVVRHAEARDLWGCAAELARLADAAKAGTATREELTGSTITITSLGSMGGIATTPVVNHPEVAIVGVNKIQVRPMWDGSQFVPRRMMNLSSSFDHRVIDGWDAAVFVQRIKALLEAPAMIFI
ncbi:branched-chain alpha-keto acid dehydrogenase E2 component [Stella humosa]|uniref:Dihydrolipoamide acetyltransferase component of pyruvate dehydrogenase complex n=1 Tax=Stella humosa TaxID=94 RepID=A0A3N1M7C3_9PROT|nr:dihydrolipoamide acetyltransferase family protein [Stella humosa]ROP99602.1 branched-chain alpha-keto acid dehydrogenase E2 component [Stella humosa]BBK31173.1 dihydrolipoamide acetyltransferase component of pyruvate dehydrogenase complex [Stella humosa]